ncbi:MAG: hypothetical protein BRD55_10375 [Bacteroidetes bacterium SW_9_63_38]|nr:MAG: hypothetical protein BRD55_10375 [Bacteroidetes bacterium SW_9_63_38]
MSSSSSPRPLDDVPDVSTIASLRDDADEQNSSVEVTYPSEEGTQKRLVVSPRGTVVVLTDVSEATFNRSRSAAEIAEELPA